jgi:hypothetical protein
VEMVMRWSKEWLQRNDGTSALGQVGLWAFREINAAAAGPITDYPRLSASRHRSGTRQVGTALRASHEAARGRFRTASANLKWEPAPDSEAETVFYRRFRGESSVPI